jgi:hypothetical protein
MPVQTNAKTRISFDIRGPFQNRSIAKKRFAISEQACRPIVNAQGGVLFCQAPGEPYGGCIEMRDAGAVADRERPLPHCSEDRANN